MNETSIKRPFIRPLPANVINKIAAGEVVERPAAVVKELVENSIDAGATTIEVVIEKAGVKLIKVVDDGCGISEDQVEIAFGRHATSKITGFNDLDALASYGFRGEALPSIASVARVRLVSRPREQASGTELIIEGGVVHSRKPVAAAVGTVIEVEDLFFNTPARRKFMRAESTESRYLSRTITAMALGRPDLGFTYRNGSREVFAAPKGQTMAERVELLLGSGRTFLRHSEEHERAGIELCLGPPDVLLNNRYGQYVFVNNRYVFSPTLSHAIRAGYGEMIPGGTFPVGVASLTIDPAEIDVNVHPSKTEIRLAFEREIHTALRHAVQDMLRQDGVITELATPGPRAGHPNRRGNGGSGPPQSSEPTGNHVIPGILNRHQPGLSDIAAMHAKLGVEPSEPPSEIVRVDTSTGEIVESPGSDDGVPGVGPSDGFRLIGRFDDLYLLLEAGSDLYIVDQHTAHERVLYELFQERIARATVESQTLLFPVTLELSPEQFAVFEAEADLLHKSGFGVSPFGGRTVSVDAVPSILGRKSPERTVLQVLDDLASSRPTGDDLIKRIAQSMACRAAVMSGDRISHAEATDLLKQLLGCRNKYTCPHGRPTFIRLRRSELDKKFGRG